MYLDFRSVRVGEALTLDFRVERPPDPDFVKRLLVSFVRPRSAWTLVPEQLCRDLQMQECHIRQRAQELYDSEELVSIRASVDREIARKRLVVRDDKDVYVGEDLQDSCQDVRLRLIGLWDSQIRICARSSPACCTRTSCRGCKWAWRWCSAWRSPRSALRAPATARGSGCPPATSSAASSSSRCAWKTDLLVPDHCPRGVYQSDGCCFVG
jgi:hypothetical protein